MAFLSRGILGAFRIRQENRKIIVDFAVLGSTHLGSSRHAEMKPSTNFGARYIHLASGCSLDPVVARLHLPDARCEFHSLLWRKTEKKGLPKLAREYLLRSLERVAAPELRQEWSRSLGCSCADSTSLISAPGLGFGRDDSSVMKFVSERVDLDVEVGFHSLPSVTTSAYGYRFG